MERVDTLVIGAGVIGLACARALATRGRQVLLLEREDTIGSGISSRNSEVIHAGLYYPAHWLKTRLCIHGRRRLYPFLARTGVPFRRCGKLVVASGTAQLTRLARLRSQAEANGVEGLLTLSPGQARELEPELHCDAALLSPESGIVDSHQLMLALQGEMESLGASLVFRCAVESIEPEPTGLRVSTSQGELRCRRLVLAGGLSTPQLLRRVRGLSPAKVPRQHLAKGNYYKLGGRSPFSRLIYPLPEAGGLGVHLTLDLSGNARFGPDVQWCDAPQFEVTQGLEERFKEAVASYWPGVAWRTLTPDYAGVRPKLSGPGEPGVDFALLGPADLGIAGLVALAGIESPGLTASLALADLVAERLNR
ncbi:NAD(P)/FAD-dependent oxidoreductase [Ferrimonas sediminicola]|uniref:NAD(P)/FAD-dependent oxidoreductase n=1 Tax=Ferrimonas sediminicola TaxID=2569538 RepID=A0A4U1B9V9_9GAMM|nr:NAD(P)/FAD-dependent oxidoreductase [Ferrimonas sediminicola]TKB46804.1 NAD(P)/FAD-dependent oxidoreductase [Ferrimonas sediminicola]